MPSAGLQETTARQRVNDRSNEHVPRLVEALSGSGAIGASASTEHTVAWTEEEAFDFGSGSRGELGDVEIHPIAAGLSVEAGRYLPMRVESLQRLLG